MDAPVAGSGFAENAAGSCTIIRNGRKSGRRIISRPFRSVRTVEPEWGPGTQRRFCGDACRIQWWTDYRKANPSLEEKPLWCECCGQALRMDQKKYCSRACYLSAMEETHRQQVCAWCGEEFSVYAGEERQYIVVRICGYFFNVLVISLDFDDANYLQ